MVGRGFTGLMRQEGRKNPSSRKLGCCLFEHSNTVGYR